MWFHTSRFGDWQGSFSRDSQEGSSAFHKPSSSGLPSEAVAVSATPITHATDPRWVLAQRTAQVMQGPVLDPEKRERLIKLGKLLGLSAFDANVIIAIVQNQAREGDPLLSDLNSCELLSQVHPPVEHAKTKLNWFTVGVCAALLLLLEVVFLLSWSQT